MNYEVYRNGTFYISNKTIELQGKTVILSNIETMNVVPCKRHSILSGIKEWLYILIVLVIICNIWRKFMWIGDLYIYTIFILVLYNIWKFTKKYYALIIQIGIEPITIESLNQEFLLDVKKIIQEAIDNSKDNSYIINIDKCTINNGIINNGNNNINKMENKK